MNALPLRWTDAPLPPYSYVPGRFPHPVTDAAGHSFGHASPPVAPPSEGRWQDCFAYLYGIDLFNRGYYWEAHESWECVWNALGRTGADADFVKALIKLAAAGVKAREGRIDGVARHATRASALLRTVLPSAGDVMKWGLELTPLIAAAEVISRRPETLVNNSPAPVVTVFPFTLDLHASGNLHDPR